MTIVEKGMGEKKQKRLKKLKYEKHSEARLEATQPLRNVH